MSRISRWPVVVVFLVVLAVQLALVGGAGTDIPYQDQWDAEGRGLYPAWLRGTWHVADLVAPYNEHRIAWTRALDLVLFAANGAWDPLVELTANAVVRALAAAGLLAALLRWTNERARWALAAGVTVAFLPHLAWQNALWGFQSHVYFALLFGIAALAWLADEHPSAARLAGGIIAGVAAQLAMGAGLLVPVALAGLLVLRGLERRRLGAVRGRELAAAAILLGCAGLLRHVSPAHAALRPSGLAEAFKAFAQAVAWPHVWTPVAALGMNLPVLLAVGLRLARRRPAAPGEDFVLLLWGWAVALAAAMAWTRGGGGEFDGGVPSRYADFLVLLPIANAWCAVALLRECAAPRRRAGRLLVAAWAGLLLFGWVALSGEVMRRLILPRLRDRDAPVRVMVEYQRTRDDSRWAWLPRLYAPHPDSRSVAAVLSDPTMAGHLPPSLQPNQPSGPLSRAVRILLRR
ncbi:MAG: hypothetical protein JSR48_13025 [Verrucomicrobia bacterium]|nr:hypothetical protein [Verrucomicrobiota bacterium]